MMSDSLLARASSRPAPMADKVAARPTAPVTALSTTSQGRAASSATASAPALSSGSLRRAPPAAPRASRTSGTAAGLATATASTPKSIACLASRPGLPPPAAIAVTRNRPGFRAMMSAAWVPIEPVEPRSTISRHRLALLAEATRLFSGVRVGRWKAPWRLPVRPQRHPGRAVGGELDPEHLVQLHDVLLEAELRPGHVEPPYPRRALAHLGDRFVPVGVEVGAPCGQRLGVVLTQVLGVPDLEAGVVHERHEVTRPFELAVREHVAIDEPGGDACGPGVVWAGDAVIEQPAPRHQLGVQEREVVGKMRLADVLRQADRADRVEVGLDHVPVVEVADFREVRQTTFLDSALRPRRLLR